MGFSGWHCAIRLEKRGKYPRSHDPHRRYFIPLADRVRIARINRGDAVFRPPHADALHRTRGDAQGPPSTRCPTEPPTQRPRGGGRGENRLMPLAGVHLTREPDRPSRHFSIDSRQRETRTFQTGCSPPVEGEMKNTVRICTSARFKSAGFGFLKPPMLPAVLIG